MTVDNYPEGKLILPKVQKSIRDRVWPYLKKVFGYMIQKEDELSREWDSQKWNDTAIEFLKLIPKFMKRVGFDASDCLLSNELILVE